MNAYTYTDIMVTVEPTDDKDPKPAWSQTVAAYDLFHHLDSNPLPL